MMTLVGLILLIIIGAVCGALAEGLVGVRLGGIFAAAALGFLGAVLGTWLAIQLRLPSLLPVTIDGQRIEIAWAILGAILIVLLLSLIRRVPYRRRP
jgi:uncharacterized membrane protein YeaQ/YmgE (transglycosylase-associated protein family)